MSKSPFDLFIDLITFDQSLHKKEQEIIALETVVEELEDKLDAAKADFDKEQFEVHDAKKAVDQEELAMQELEEKAKKIQERFSHASNNQEYLAVKKESEEIQQAQMDVEAAVITAWNNLENAQKNTASREKAFEETKEKIAAEIEEQQKKVDALEVQFQAVQKERKDKIAGIPEEWLEKYQRMSTTVSDPVSPVEDQNCKACFHTLTSQEMTQLARKKLLQCKGCYRFLYSQYTPAVEADNGG